MPVSVTPSRRCSGSAGSLSSSAARLAACLALLVVRIAMTIVSTTEITAAATAATVLSISCGGGGGGGFAADHGNRIIDRSQTKFLQAVTASFGLLQHSMFNSGINQSAEQPHTFMRFALFDHVLGVGRG
eukprot:scaffold34140_cov62-Phaeocystis_antarctica.AAC.2